MSKETSRMITVELSLYPLAEDYAPAIRDFIARLKKHQQIEVMTTATSTQVVGEHSEVFNILSEETKKTFESGKHAFVIKILSFERDIKQKR